MFLLQLLSLRLIIDPLFSSKTFHPSLKIVVIQNGYRSDQSVFLPEHYAPTSLFFQSIYSSVDYFLVLTSLLKRTIPQSSQNLLP